MIGLSRLKRAIEDLPTGGMQTGDPKVRLKLCDAQLLEVEFNAIIAERDNALAQNAEFRSQLSDAADRLDRNIVEKHEAFDKLSMVKAQNAELVAQVKALRSAAKNAYMQWNYSNDVHDGMHKLIKAVNATPTQHLRDRDADAGRAGFIACSRWINDEDDGRHTVTEASDEYAEKVRRGEV